MAEIGNRTGHHYYYHQPVSYSGGQYVRSNMPFPRLTGVTVRMFVYAPFEHRKRILLSLEINYVFYMRSAIYEDDIYINPYRTDKKVVTITPEPKLKVTPGTFFSLAVRIEDDTHLRGYFDRDMKTIGEVRTLSDPDYEVFFGTNGYFLLSVHVTCETETTATLWNYNSSFILTYLPLHTSCMYIVRSYGDDPDKFYIKVTEKYIRVDYPMGKGKVKMGQYFLYDIRRVIDGLLVTVDFHPNKNTFIPIYHDAQLNAEFHEHMNIIMVECHMPFSDFRNNT